VNILFNYFPKQIDDAKEVYDACNENTKQKFTLNYWVTICARLSRS
jgi:heptosyltransferase-2